MGEKGMDKKKKKSREADGSFYVCVGWFGLRGVCGSLMKHDQWSLWFLEIPLVSNGTNIKERKKQVHNSKSCIQAHDLRNDQGSWSWFTWDTKSASPLSSQRCHLPCCRTPHRTLWNHPCLTAQRSKRNNKFVNKNGFCVFFNSICSLNFMISVLMMIYTIL